MIDGTLLICTVAGHRDRTRSEATRRGNRFVRQETDAELSMAYSYAPLAIIVLSVVLFAVLRKKN